MKHIEKDRLKLFDTQNIDTLVWPKSEEGLYAKKFIEPLMVKGVHHYFDNIETELLALQIDDLVLPVTVNEEKNSKCYVCSPYSHYISYGKETIDKIENSILRRICQFSLGALKVLLSFGEVHKVVIVNNWLFSTDLYPELNNEQIKTIIDHLKQRFPQHSILFRSISSKNDRLYQILKDHCSFIAARQVYFLNTKNDSIFSKRIFKKDTALLENSGYEVLGNNEIKEEEISRILTLYKGIFIEKYSSLNPQPNHHFIQLALSTEILQFRVLKKKGQIDAVGGYFHLNGTFVSPFFGYDHTQTENPLYQLISGVLIQEARKKRAFYNLSSGGSSYKQKRGTEKSIEYIAVYHRHLPVKKRVIWKILQGTLNTFGVRFMEYQDKNK